MCQANRTDKVGKKKETGKKMNCFFLFVVVVTFFLGFGATQRDRDDSVGRY